MKFAILFALLAYALHSTIAEYRYKLRGPPLPPRPPPVPHYVKKWQQHMHRPPVRARPIPVHMPSSYKIPMGVPSGPRPVAPPVRTFWKTTQATYRAPPEKKPFQSSPKVNLPEFDYHIQTNSIPDYHIQTNSIPTHTNPIKQVGEKGPIHTIPAPNLSLADKPIVVEEVQHQHQHQHQQQHAQLLQFPQINQYQVTEQSESGLKNANKLYRGQQSLYLGPNLDISGLQAQTSMHQAEAAAIQQALQGGPALQHALQQQSFAFPSPTTFETQSSTAVQNEHLFGHLQDQVAAQVSPQETYQPHTMFSQQQPQLDAYFQQGQLQQNYGQQFHRQNQQQQQQQISNYEALISQAQAYQDVPGFAQQFEKLANENVKQPEFHSFNYEEQNQRSSSGHQDISSLVTAAYNLEPAAAEASELHKAIVRNPADALAQTEYVQNYFDTRDDNIATNKVEPDAKQSDPASLTEQRKQQLLSTAFYSTLPNKKAAETLATLQAAGQINSNLMQMGRQKNPIAIYVPDETSNSGSNTETKENEQADYGFNQYSDNKSKEYDDYPQEESKEDVKEADEESTQDDSQESFGDRLKPKRNQK